MRNWIIIGIILVCFLALSIVLRIVVPFADVMGDGIKFTEVDSYYFMRVVDVIQSGGSGAFETDPLLNFPHGGEVYGLPSSAIEDQQSMISILPIMTALISSWFNWDAELVAVYLPVAAGILMLISVFVLCWLMWGKWTATICTALVSIMPGELLSRTSLGYFDNHALELLFAAFMLMFLVLALKKHWLWCIGAGVFLGLYDLLWTGALIINVVVILWVAVQSIIYHHNKEEKKSLQLTIIGTIMLTEAFFVYLIVNNYTLSYIVIYGIFVVITYLINILSVVMKQLKTWYYVGALMLLGIAVLLSGWFIKNALIVGIINSMFGITGSSIVSGMQVLVFQTAWSYYGLVLYFGIAGLIWFYMRNWQKPENTLFILWGIVFLIFAVLWVRFNYYLAVIVAMFTGYACIEAWKYLNGATVKRLGLAFIVVMFLFVPNTVQSFKIADYHPYLPNRAWSEALSYLKSKPIMWSGVSNHVAGKEAPEFCVLSLWDYGYWIARDGGQAVFCSPSGSESQGLAIKYLTSASDSTRALVESRVRYIVIDRSMVGDKYGKLRNGTKLEDSYMYKVWTGQFKNVQLIFESESKYGQSPEVRIFEIKGV